MSITTAEILDRIAELRARQEEFCVVTVVRTENATSAKAGAKAVVTKDGTLHGFIGGTCVQGAVGRVAAEVLASGAPKLIRVKPKDDPAEQAPNDGIELHGNACPSGGTVELFVEPMLMAPRCIICGTSPVAASLVALAKVMGYRTILAAPTDQANLIEGADHYVDGYNFSGIDISADDAVVVATQGRKDRDALHAALASDAVFVAMIGSRRKAAVLQADMVERGLSAARIAALRAPAGLDIGAIEPEEIALSIIGDIVRHRRSAVRENPVPIAGQVETIQKQPVE